MGLFFCYVFVLFFEVPFPLNKELQKPDICFQPISIEVPLCITETVFLLDRFAIQF